jgi:hypothetical protein
MKSILAQQSQQRSPWAPARLWQEMQTGRSKRSAAMPTAPRKAAATEMRACRASARSEAISTPPIPIAP